ncbi:hypothetical protein HZR84_10060 [Hyphobacterium sp. CCMP332]|nr:hypothetical protein HZR84_10060 [Hyphobacterium sp. CCMP332]
MKSQKQFITVVAVLILSSIFLSEVSLMLFDQPLEETYEEREEKRDTFEKEEDLNNSRKINDNYVRDYISNEEFSKLNSNKGVSIILDESANSGYSKCTVPLFINYCCLKVNFC